MNIMFQQPLICLYHGLYRWLVQRKRFALLHVAMINLTVCFQTFCCIL